MYLNALRATVKTLASPYFLRMLFLCMLVTGGMLALFAFGTGTLVGMMRIMAGGWQDTLLGFVAGAGALLFAWFLFPVLVPLIGVVFLENIANHVERQEYQLGDIPSLPFGGEVMHALRFGLFALGLNLLLLPVYLLLSITVIFGPLLYYMVNGYLLGREFFELAGARHVGRKEATRLRKRYPTAVFLGGVTTLLLGTIPPLNLVAPFLGAALSVHLFRHVAKAERLMLPAATP